MNSKKKPVVKSLSTKPKKCTAKVASPRPGLPNEGIRREPEELPVLQDLKARTTGRTAIILTSFPFQQYRETYLAAGADYFFDKTQDIEKLTTVLVELAAKNGGSLDV